MISDLKDLNCDEFGCFEPKIGELFWLKYKWKDYILRTVEASRLCTEKQKCFLYDKKTRCGKLVCRASERKDGCYVMFEDVTREMKNKLIEEMEL